MDDPVFKTKYHKYKTKVKVWEKSFKEKNGRVPSKHDIREAPSAIRDSYKMYYKLKTSFLEETLSDALDEDSFDLSILESSSQTESRMSGSFSELSTPDVSALTNENSIILPMNNSVGSSNSMATSSRGYYESRVSEEFDAEIASTVNENAWNEVPKNSSTAAIESGSSSGGGGGSVLRKSLSNKLFRNSSFFMRNPRKSLSKNSLTSNSQSSLSSSQASLRKESFPDLETILSQKSKQQTETDDNDEQSSSQANPAAPLDVKTIAAAAATLSATAISSVKHLDDEWLKRCHQANSIALDDDYGDLMANLADSHEPSRSTTGSDAAASAPADKPKVFGISNINAAALAKFEQKQILESPEIGGAKTMLSFDMSNLNLVAKKSFVANAVSAMSFDVINDGDGNADDEEIANSEDETETNNTSRQIRSIRCSTKRKRSEIDDVIPAAKVRTSDTNDAVLPIERPATGNLQRDVPKKDASVTVRKTKSKAKVIKVQAAPTVKTTEIDAKVEIVQRRSSRTANKPQTYKEITLDDLKSKRGDADDDDEKEDEEEEDPFAGDDSDNDPNFAIPQSPKSKQPINDDSDSSSECSDAEKLNVMKKETAAKPVKQRVARVKKAPAAPTSAKPRTSTGARKVRTARKKVEPNKVADAHNSSIDENGAPPEDTPDDYLLEFGIEQLSSVPRIPVTELQQNTMEFSKYVCNAPTIAATVNARPNGAKQKRTTAATAPVATKASMAREKLESKIAAGTLNENYVRLNLRKKVFVRGKKTMNFSRYKKKLWKSKKVAALSGPDMDMRGCDGGILTCFQCGMPGHFAQNCKVKSDRLLPLTVEEDSPFPTLDEVEQMSNQQIKLAHANRELPKVQNPTWKLGSDEGGSSEESAKTAPVAIKTNASDTTSSLPPPPSTDTVIDDSIVVPVPNVSTQNYIGHKIPEEFLKKAGLLGSDTDDSAHVEPLYKLNADGSVGETPAEVYEALAKFGHKQFRSGQERAVMRILSGQSTLVTLSTGSGKSLCYQLPAYMYSRRKRCITLVISPLVSLMEDQVQGVPDFLNAHCLHTNLTPQKRAATIEAIKAGNVDVLLISPEAVVSSEKTTGFGSILKDLPPVAFVCIDECHCVSQFGHNFRPSYLMVCRVLYEKLKIKTVLGLTATATISTRLSIVEHLRIPDGLNGVISDIPLPDNLTLTISCDDSRDIALVQLLREPRFVEYKSIIIYCSRRDECERVAKNLRTYFQDNIARELELRNASGKRRRALKTTIEPYHAGMAGSRRRTIQNAFMRGDLKIVVATIAFGMGINKADIRCVIHYNMPMNFESYVQEVGRAGRDGLPAHCHLFLDSKGEDKIELRRHIYANSIDRHVIRKLLHKIFIPCACKQSTESKTETTTSNAQDASSIMSDLDAVQQINWNDDMQDGAGASGDGGSVPAKRQCPGHEVCFSVDETIQELDIPEENISTLLCYLELHDQQYVKALSKAYIRCKVLSYGGAKALKAAAQKCPPLAMAIALDIRKGISHESSTFIEFPVVEIASAIGWNSGVVKYQLKQLEWTTVNGQPKRSNISVEFSDLGFRVLAPGDLSPIELDATLNMLYSRVQEQEHNQINQLENVFRGLTSVAVKSSLACANAEPNNEKSERLKKIVREYFQSNKMVAYTENEESAESAASDPDIDKYIMTDIDTMISRYPENNFTGRSMARIFHGVQSPVFPAVIWSRCKYWRAHLKTDFNHIVKLTNAVILRNRAR